MTTSSALRTLAPNLATHVLDEVLDAIQVRSLQGELLYWNRRAEMLFGPEGVSLAGRVNYAEAQVDQASIYRDAHMRVRSRGHWRGELRHQDARGLEVVLDSRWTLLEGQKGHPTLIVMVDEDVSERKTLETQLYRTQRLESLGTLASGVAHDLNNVLMPIIMSADLLRQPRDAESQASIIENIERSAQRGADILRQMLTFARGAQGRQVVMQPRHIIREVENVIRQAFPRTIRLYIHTHPEEYLIRADATQVQQVLMNLCVNARDAMEEGGRLTVRSEAVDVSALQAERHPQVEAGRFLRIAVEDTGAGIPPETLDKIFEPFFTTKQLGMGTGLGLSTVHSIMRSHRGFIDVKSQLGTGTTFQVFFPILEGAQIDTEAEKAQPIIDGQARSILVVDDEEAVRTVLQQVLEECGFRVLTAQDGTEGVALLAQHRDEVELVITDMMMPYMDGPATLRVIRRIKPDVLVIAMSGVLRDIKADMRTLDVAAYLPKPFSTQQLLEVLADLDW
ncbi:MAG: response regulator [Rhodothermales bacterium]